MFYYYNNVETVTFSISWVTSGIYILKFYSFRLLNQSLKIICKYFYTEICR
jgi:hypothetical protein